MGIITNIVVGAVLVGGIKFYGKVKYYQGRREQREEYANMAKAFSRM